MKIKKMMMLMLSTMMLAGCDFGGNDTTTEENKPSENKTEEKTNTENKETTTTEDTGKKTVNVYMPSPSGLQTKIEKGFEAAYQNIDMVVTSGTTGELLAKIEAEKANPVCDVLILASWSDGINSLTNLDLMAYTPVDGDKLDTPFKHESNKIWGTSASAVGVIYNSDLVDKTKIEKLDWSDYASKEKIDSVLIDSGEARMSIPDPTKSGACKDFLAGFVSSKGEEASNTVFTGWANNGMKNGGGNKTALADIESGKIDILVGGVDYNAYSDKKKGKKIDFYYPKGGTVVNARPAMIMNTAKHVDEAKKVMDYLCTKESQGFVSDSMLIPGRKDVSCNSYRASYSDINTFTNLDWNYMASNGTKIATDFVAKLK